MAQLLSIPDWLTGNFLEKHLQNHFKNTTIGVVNFLVKPPSNDGNFASKIYRVHVQFNTVATEVDTQAKQEPSSVDLIIKQGASSEVVLNAFHQYDVYDNEMEFYGKIVPKFNQKLKILGELDLVAEPFGIWKKENILILENLSAKGYQAQSPAQGFDVHETRAVLKRAATFHAICAVLQEEQSDIFGNFKAGHMTRGTNAFDITYKSHMDIIADIISEWPGFEGYAVKLRHIRDDVVERGYRLYDVKSNHFNTLVHDDLWSTNLMIKPCSTPEDTKKPIENVIFIDFQFAFWSSPAIDLYYFLNSSLCDTLRPNHLDELVEYYHEQLVDYLKRLNFGKYIPTWPEFYAQYRERRFYGFIVSCLVQPLHINDTVKVDIETLILDNEENLQARRNLYKNPRVQNNLRKLIPYYDQLGVFDSIYNQ